MKRHDEVADLKVWLDQGDKIKYVSCLNLSDIELRNIAMIDLLPGVRLVLTGDAIARLSEQLSVAMHALNARADEEIDKLAERISEGGR